MQAGGTKCRARGTGLSEENRNRRSRRVWLYAAAWSGLVAILWGTDLAAKYLAGRQSGYAPDTFRLVSEQVTSAFAVLIMIPFLVHWLKLFPLSLQKWPRVVIGHTIGSMFFAFGHFVLMVGMRIPWYAFNGRSYVWREPFANNLIVEYQKDIKIYIGFVVLLSAYRYYRGAAAAKSQPYADRLVVQTGSGNSVLHLDDIDYVEAARNYVAVHAGGREYIVRDTLTNLSRRLSAGPFERTHRSYLVNLDKIREIKTADSGTRIILTTGAEVPLSRTYREGLAQKLGL